MGTASVAPCYRLDRPFLFGHVPIDVVVKFLVVYFSSLIQHYSVCENSSATSPVVLKERCLIVLFNPEND